jgi:GAF domain-containing protein/HAMP domain-containing protein
MKITTKLIVVLLLVSVLPLAVASYAGLRAMDRVGSLATDESTQALKGLGEDSIHRQALSVARQVELYLEAHPEMLTIPAKELEADKELAAIALQPVGKTGYTALYDSGAVTHFHSNPAIVGTDLHTLAGTLPEFWRIMEASLSGAPVDGYYKWKEADGSLRDKYMSCVPVGKTRFRVAATTYIDEFSQPIQNTQAKIAGISQATQWQLVGVAGMAGVLAVLAAVFLGVMMVRPLGRIAEGAQLLSQGKLDHELGVGSQDEIGQLAAVINQMAREIKRALQEKDNAARQAERRAAQIATGAEISGAASQVLDPDELLRHVVRLIAERFESYYTAVFLVDEAGQNAVLRAATGTTGQVLLEHGHKLGLDGNSMVGWVCVNKQARIALDADAEAIRFVNPLLPDTRSEMALPLRAGERVIGALDIQCTRVQAFDAEDITALQGMADQIAVALENARLFQQAQSSLKEVEQANRLLTQQGWEAFLRSTQADFAEFHQPGVPALTPEETDKLAQESRSLSGQNGTVSIPLRVRRQVIGTLVVERGPDRSEWSATELGLIQEMATQAALAMENARSFEQSQRIAARERLVGQVTTHMRETLDMNTILQTAVREIAQTLDAQQAELRLGTGPLSGKVSHGAGPGKSPLFTPSGSSQGSGHGDGKEALE